MGKAAIVDQLGDSYPNTTFFETSRSILNDSGFKVYYFGAGSVDVNFYRNLPNQGFSVIILRVHSAINQESNFLVLFTSEPFNDVLAGSTYLSDFLSDPPRLVRARIQEDSQPFFGITPLFVDTMKGDFDHTLIIMMGCNGLESQHTSMAQALVKKGAQVYIGFDGFVSPSHTDDATTRLLREIFVENKTIQEAVIEVNSEVGPDPEYASKLLWYPPERGGYVLTSSLPATSARSQNSFSCLIPFRKSEDSPEACSYCCKVTDVYDPVLI